MTSRWLIRGSERRGRQKPRQSPVIQHTHFQKGVLLFPKKSIAHQGTLGLPPCRPPVWVILASILRQKQNLETEAWKGVNGDTKKKGRRRPRTQRSPEAASEPRCGPAPRCLGEEQAEALARLTFLQSPAQQFHTALQALPSSPDPWDPRLKLKLPSPLLGPGSATCAPLNSTHMHSHTHTQS